MGYRFRSDAGYTLLELSTVIAIILVVTIVVVASVSSVRRADLSSSSARVAASVRYLYDLAVLNNRPYKLVIDMGSGTYWGEEAGQIGGCGEGLLPSEEEIKFGAKESGGGKAQRAAAPKSPQASSAPAPAPVRDEAPRGEPAAEGSATSPAKANLLTETKLPRGIAFGGVMTSHQDEPSEEGRAEIFVFPSGYVEKAFIYLRQDEDLYTVETVPLKGMAKVHPERLDPRGMLDRT